MSVDVLIVGGGPVGTALAVELARYGVNLRIVEKTAPGQSQSQALILWSRTLELLDRAGVTAALVAAGTKLTAANIVAKNKTIGRIDFSSVASPYPFLLGLPQGDTEHLLEQQLNKLGVRIEYQSELVFLRQTGGANRPSGVSAAIKIQDGQTETVEAKFLVGCDGPHSIVRGSMATPVLGGEQQSDWVLADLHLTGAGLNPSEFTIFWHEKGALALLPIRGNSYRILADLGKARGSKRPDPTLEEIQALLDERGPGGLQASDPIWLWAFRGGDTKVRDYRNGRVFLAGDAAHAHSPIGAQGLNMGIQDAVNLAWKLALVIKGICPEEKLLPSYSVERSAVTDQVAATISRLTAAATLRNQPLQTVRNLLGQALLGLSPLRQAMADNLAELSQGYAHSPLNAGDDAAFPGPGLGDRMAPLAGAVPVGAGETPRFSLFADASPEINEILRKHADLLEPALRPPVSQRCVWLVRPDGYVSAVTLDTDVKMIGDYLEGLKEE